MLLLAATYVIPLAALTVTYTRVGVKLWGSKTIGERTTRHDETLRSKRKVNEYMNVMLSLLLSTNIYANHV